MSKKRLVAIIGLLLITGCAHFESMEGKEQKYGKAAPAIDQYFASAVMKQGENWKIYLKASDPDGDMNTIFSYLDSGSRRGSSAPSLVRLKDEDRKEFSGYLYWYPGPQAEPFSEFVMTIQIQDKAGHYSLPISLAVSLRPSGRQEVPPEGAFKERDLGPIMIEVKPVGGAGAGP